MNTIKNKFFPQRKIFLMNWNKLLSRNVTPSVLETSNKSQSLFINFFVYSKEGKEQASVVFNSTKVLVLGSSSKLLRNNFEEQQKQTKKGDLA